jgi:ATP-dependent Clp protease protease subunit
MQFIRPDVMTICLGQAASAAAVLLTAGTPGKRFALANSRILLHQPSSEGQGQGSDIAIQAKEIMRIKELQEQMLSKHTGQSIKTIAKDLSRDKIFDAKSAIEYGIIDNILSSRKKIII